MLRFQTFGGFGLGILGLGSSEFRVEGCGVATCRFSGLGWCRVSGSLGFRGSCLGMGFCS